MLTKLLGQKNDYYAKKKSSIEYDLTKVSKIFVMNLWHVNCKCNVMKIWLAFWQSNSFCLVKWIPQTMNINAIVYHHRVKSKTKYIKTNTYEHTAYLILNISHCNSVSWKWLSTFAALHDGKVVSRVYSYYFKINMSKQIRCNIIL